MNITYHTERGMRFPLNGYRYDLENAREIEATSTDVSRLLKRVGNVELPKEFDPRQLFRLDPRDDMQVEDQGQQGSCRGHSGSSCVEFVNWIETKRMVQLSRAYMYYATQKEDGISGDRGSTINGGVKVLRQYGIPREEHWPYPSSYDPRPPGGWEQQYQRAAEFKINSHTFLTTAEDTVQYLRGGIGPVDIGVSWGGEVDSRGVFQWRPGGGGHAIALLGWKQDGRDMYVWLLNSWGTRWGMNGWALVHIKTLAEMLRHQHTVFVGYSDMASPDHVRRINLVDDPLYA